MAAAPPAPAAPHPLAVEVKSLAGGPSANDAHLDCADDDYKCERASFDDVKKELERVIALKGLLLRKSNDKDCRFGYCAIGGNFTVNSFQLRVVHKTKMTDQFPIISNVKAAYHILHDVARRSKLLADLIRSWVKETTQPLAILDASGIVSKSAIYDMKFVKDVNGGGGDGGYTCTIELPNQIWIFMRIRDPFTPPLALIPDTHSREYFNLYSVLRFGVVAITLIEDVCLAAMKRVDDEAIRLALL